MEWTKPSKGSFFAALEKLDQSDDSDDEYDSLERIAALGPSNISKTTAPSVSDHCEAPVYPQLARSSADPKLSSLSSLSFNNPSADCDIEEINRNTFETQKPRRTEQTVIPTVRRVHTLGAMAGTKNGGPASKKRKPNNTKIVPENQQIFKDFVLFFFPNNDISPPRRLRIQRAQEYGAKWERQWSNSITHVILDKGLGYQDLLKHLKLDLVPEKVVIVNEIYLSDCIKFRSVLSPIFERFRVDGTPEKAKNAEHTEPARTEPKSLETLPLKQSNREKLQCQGQESTQNSSMDGMTILPANEPIKEHNLGAGLRERDVLDDLIDESKAISHLPLDFLDSADERAGAGVHESDDESVESSESEIPRKRKIPKGRKGNEGNEGNEATESWAKSFACMQKFDPDAQRDNPNAKTIEILQQIVNYYDRTADHWRSFAYRKGINALRRQTEKIVTRKQARSIPGIGERLADKIQEIVLTNRLRQLDNTNYTAEDRIIQEFIGIYGVGLSQASKWLAQGHRSLVDLLEKAHLSTNQRIGVERYHDFMQRIPRKEVEAHGAIVQKAVQAADPDMQVIIAGSYRRGAPNSGDIDVLITKPNASLEYIRGLMQDVVIPKLFQDEFLRVGLATSKRHDHDGSKWHGASTVPGSPVWRRIDLLFVPGAEFGAALLYFTGNDIFNRSMRLLARKKGLCLNQRGLYTNVLRDAQRVKVNPGRLLEGRDERRIFALLEVPWRPPQERIC
ncbi:hypothetical protein N7478_005191 [Penicillium angulare]|uniref:uncharacterized protein n=1 Tax=Penicillium angulare TaxID=116970 RepID=UPI00254002E6|nr:uncharacterized protein N7478_005191 [Penicillium angulare]KAJ5279819.1 hypothetical protein N7478_005191 [Penicillium angulare]